MPIPYRGQGIGRQLYEYLFNIAHESGCEKIKAITSLSNRESIAFHKRIGMKLLGSDFFEDIPYVANYSGVNEHRVVFVYDLIQDTSNIELLYLFCI